MARQEQKSKRPAINPEVREQQMIAYAMDLAEKQLREGTASSQIITEYLKRGSRKAELELERLRHENELLKAKTEAIEATQRIEAKYEEALKAMKLYSGRGDDEDEDVY